MLMKGNGKTEPLILIDDNDTHQDNTDGTNDMDLIYIDAGDNNPYNEFIDDNGKLNLDNNVLCLKLNQCINAVMEDFILKYGVKDDDENYVLDRYGAEEDITYDILNRQDTEQCNKQLLQWYKVRGGVNNRCPVFFRVNDIQNHYRRYKAYKNVKSVSDMMDKLVNKGYANKMSKLDGYNIYYLTTNCRNLKKQELTQQDITDASNFLIDTGFYDYVNGDNDG